MLTATEQLSEQNANNEPRNSLPENSGAEQISSSSTEALDDESYPSTAVALTVMAANFFSMFLVSLVFHFTSITGKLLRY